MRKAKMGGGMMMKRPGMKKGSIPPQLKKYVMAKKEKSCDEKEKSVMVKKIKKVAKALKKASALHKKQSKVIEKHIKEMKRGGSKKRYG